MNLGDYIDGKKKPQPEPIKEELTSEEKTFIENPEIISEG